MFKLMVTAPSSGSGKTAITCGLLSLLQARGLQPCAFKCGPDYIDPMFHRSVLGIPSDNLDVFLAGEAGVRQVFQEGIAGHDAAICEGVMGYYDGVTQASAAAQEGQTAHQTVTQDPGGMHQAVVQASLQASSSGVSLDAQPDAQAGADGNPAVGNAQGAANAGTYASAWHVANLLEIPTLLVIHPKGAALTLAAVIKGLCTFRSPSRICACILNDCSESYARRYAPVIEAETGIPVVGHLPHMEEAAFESRHLGLLKADEMQDLGERIQRIGETLAKTLNLPRLMQAAGGVYGSGHRVRTEAEAAAEVHNGPSTDVSVKNNKLGGEHTLPLEFVRAHAANPAGACESQRRPRIAVARDAAFNFLYAASIRALEQVGAEILWWSPLRDAALPEQVHGLYLPGGYPELHARQLSQNVALRSQVREMVLSGLPTIAECGGFLYLSEHLTDTEGVTWPMAGVFTGTGVNAGSLVRFGYGLVTALEDSMLFRAGEAVPVHEFHYWDTQANGEDLLMTKQATGRSWHFGYATKTLYAGFPHLYLAGNHLAERFVQAAAAYADKTNGNFREV